MKKVSIITTGGTIGSILKKGSYSVENGDCPITKRIQAVGDEIGISTDVTSPINKNSENITPSDWIRILQAIKAANDSDSDGIVVTHGTDTMAYTVAAAVAFHNLWRKKVCFTGSYYAPDSPNSDVYLNLRTALEFAIEKKPSRGVYLAFREDTHNQKAKVILGADIKPMAYDGLFFDAEYNKTRPDKYQIPHLGSEFLPEIKAVESATEKIAMIGLYPGINKKLLQRISEGKKFLILNGYHSGTGPTDEHSGILQFVKVSNPRLKVIMTTFPKRYIKTPYSSTIELISAGVNIYDLQAHFVYTFILLGLALKMSAVEMIEKMRDRAMMP